jgi:nucleoid-associated protein YgaU
MRKDVKIGLGIGGVLLAVLIVYLLVPKTNDGGYARNGDSAETNDGGLGVGSTPDSPGAVTSQGQGTGQASGASNEPGTVGQTPEPVATQTPGTADTGADPATPPASKFDWETVLATGIVPEDARIGLVAQNPPVVEDIFADKSGKAAPEPDWSGTRGGATPGTITTPTAPKTDPSVAGGSNRTGTANGAPRATVKEHVVQQGENLSMIASVAYGDARLYREILKANPTLDERKLRPGTVIKMPDPATFAAKGAQQASARQEASVNNKTEYRVQQGDSLHKIALKLYGKAGKADSLYEANKDKIGDDSSRLKLGMVLKLPEPPTGSQ